MEVPRARRGDGVATVLSMRRRPIAIREGRLRRGERRRVARAAGADARASARPTPDAVDATPRREPDADRPARRRRRGGQRLERPPPVVAK